MKNLLRITAVVFLASAVQFGSVLATGDKGSIRGREKDQSEGDTGMPRTLHDMDLIVHKDRIEILTEPCDCRRWA